MNFGIPTLLISLSFHIFPFKNMQLWTLDGQILDSNFSQSSFLSKFAFQTAARMTLDGRY